MAESYESILLVKSEVFVYKIPPRTTNRGYRANEWNLDTPHWTGRMRVVSKGNICVIKLEDKTSGQLFAQAPIEQYPGIAVESVSDSSRYFVLRIQDDNGIGRNAFIGIGFADRSDSFDLNVALQDHFKYVQKEAQNEKDKDTPKPGLNLGFKEGETIKINMKITKKDGGESARSKAKAANAAGGGLGILPPPPGGVKLAPPPNVSREPTPTSSPTHQPHPPPAKPAVDQSNTDWVQF